MDRVKREPVALAGVVILAANAIIAWLMAMGWLNWNSEQVASFENLIIVLVELAVLIVPLYIARKRVTPVSDPRDSSGEPAQLLPKDYQQ